MFLQPKKTKYKKIQKGKLKKFKIKNNTIQFGEIGLKAINSGTINAYQIEAARKAIVRKIKRKGKIWICIFPSLPITSKVSESRMGKGKGLISHWVVKVKRGTTLFEVCGVPENISIEALTAGSKKLPVKTKIFD
jgi:large subunit ribosomal protein L16